MKKLFLLLLLLSMVVLAGCATWGNDKDGSMSNHEGMSQQQGSCH